MRKLMLAAALVLTVLGSRPTPVRATTGHWLFSGVTNYASGGCGVWISPGGTYAILGSHSFEGVSFGPGDSVIGLTQSNIGALATLQRTSGTGCATDSGVGSCWTWSLSSPNYGTADGTAIRTE
jgi:hypothetical protein